MSCFNKIHIIYLFFFIYPLFVKNIKLYSIRKDQKTNTFNI
jgi:hypothetical protein